MTESEAAHMVEEFRAAWDDPLSASDAREVAKLLRAYSAETVAEVIADRIEAELPRPGLLELSRVLRVYSGGATKDPEPAQPLRRPQAPWAKDMPALPPKCGPNLARELDALRNALDIGRGLFDLRPQGPPEPPVIELTVVPPQLRTALDVGRAVGANRRKARRAPNGLTDSLS